MNTCDYLLFFFFKLILMNINRHRIDSGWNMFKADSLVFKYLKNFSSKTNFTVHHGLFNIDRTETFFACNTGNHIFRLAAGTLYNKRSLVFRTVCVTDIDRNTFFTNREDCIFMKNSCSHIRKLSKLPICDSLDHCRVLNDSRICYQESGNICSVFINICMNCFCHQRTCNIRTAS